MMSLQLACKAFNHTTSSLIRPLVLLLAAGLPIGFQIVGGHGQDQAVLAAAAAFERAHDYHRLVPRDVREEGNGSRSN